MALQGCRFRESVKLVLKINDVRLECMIEE